MTSIAYRPTLDVTLTGVVLITRSVTDCQWCSSQGSVLSWGSLEAVILLPRPCFGLVSSALPCLCLALSALNDITKLQWEMRLSLWLSWVLLIKRTLRYCEIICCVGTRLDQLTASRFLSLPVITLLISALRLPCAYCLGPCLCLEHIALTTSLLNADSYMKYGL